VNLKCNRPLFSGRTCCHVKGHDGRHSHTWQRGEARYLDIDERIIDMETGEVAGYSGDLAQRIIGEITGARITGPQPSRDEIQAKARRVLEMQYGFNIPDRSQRVYASAPTGYDWHYEGETKAIGIDASGHDVEFDFTSGKVQRIYSVNQRSEAVAYARRFGTTKAAQKFDIPVRTVTTWKSRAK
jgi:hypothetical protein